VAGTFSDIAEGELGKLFHRFRLERGPTVLQRLPETSRKEPFSRYLAGSHFGLGEMIFEIDATRRLPKPRYPELKHWLRTRASRLVENWDSGRAQRLNSLRRGTSHPGGEISEQDAIELYDLSVWLISQLGAA
jgi:hypothetical protein